MASLDAVPDDAVRACKPPASRGPRGSAAARRARSAAARGAVEAVLPIIAPPSLSDTMLTLAAHGATLRALYARYRRWQRARLRLRNKARRARRARRGGCARSRRRRRPSASTRGTASLLTARSAPRGAAAVVAATHGVRRRVAGRGATAGGRRSRRLQRGRPDEQPSRFYQQRDRDEDEELRRDEAPTRRGARSRGAASPTCSRRGQRRRAVAAFARHGGLGGMGLQPDSRLPQLPERRRPSGNRPGQRAARVLPPADSVEIAYLKDARHPHCQISSA